MKIAFGHHRNFLDSGEKRPGTFGLHTAAENIALSLAAETGAVEQLGPLRNIPSLTASLRILAYKKLRNQIYYDWAEPSLSRNYGLQMASKLKNSDVDVVLCNETKHVSFLHTDRKVVLWTDTLYGGIFDYYKTFTNLCQRTRRALEIMDREAVKNCDRMIFSSDWAGRVAIDRYGADPGKIKTVPYGANFTSGLSRTDTHALVANKRFDGSCRLLFSGVEWERKGGTTALQVVNKLRNSGIPAEITILGTDAHQHLSEVPEYVQCAGFLSLSNPDDLALMKRYYSEAHFLLQPSIAECFGHIFPEANSFALPVIASETGGIPTAVHNGINGYCVPMKDVDAYVERITALFRNPEEYIDLSLKAYDDFHARLSWQQGAKVVVQILKDIEGID